MKTADKLTWGAVAAVAAFCNCCLRRSRGNEARRPCEARPRWTVATVAWMAGNKAQR